MAATNAFPVPSLSVKPPTSTGVKPTVVPQMLNELIQRSDWLIQLVTDVGLVLAGASPYPSTGLPLVFAGNITTLSTSTATFGGPVNINGLTTIANSVTIGTTGFRRTLLVQGPVVELGRGSSLIAAAAVVGTTLTIPTQSVGGIASPCVVFSVPNAGGATTISTIADPTGFTFEAGASLKLLFGSLAANNYTLNNAGNLRVNGGSIALTATTAPIVPAASTSVVVVFLFDGARWQMQSLAGNA